MNKKIDKKKTIKKGKEIKKELIINIDRFPF